MQNFKYDKLKEFIFIHNFLINFKYMQHKCKIYNLKNDFII